jgi:hypothetical protein
LDVGFEPVFDDMVDIDNVTVRVSNPWAFPVSSQWAKFTVDGEEIAFARPNVELIKPLETMREIIYDLSFISSTKGSRVTIDVEFGATKVSRTFSVP